MSYPTRPSLSLISWLLLAALAVLGLFVLNPQTLSAQSVLDDLEATPYSTRTDLDTSIRSDDFRCDIELIDEPILASSEGGLITEILSEGTEVKEAMVVARTDSEDAELMRQAAWFQWQSTLENVNSDIRERYSAANANAAEASYRMVVEANRKAERAVAQAEVDRREWDWKAAVLSIENEAHERAITRITAQKEEMDYKRAEAMVRRHNVKSPINGVVVARKRKVGEFVRPGDEVIQVARLDRLKAKGTFYTTDILPHEARGRNVTIEIEIAGETKTFGGQVSFVDTQVVTSDNSYFVWVEFDNLPNYVIRPGMEGRMRLSP